MTGSSGREEFHEKAEEAEAGDVPAASYPGMGHPQWNRGMQAFLRRTQDALDSVGAGAINPTIGGRRAPATRALRYGDPGWEELEMTKPHIERVRLDQLTGAMCGWAGCGTSAPFGTGGLLPEGWRALIVSKYSLLEPAGVLKAEVDMMLCPEHVGALRRLLKQFPGIEDLQR